MWFPILTPDSNKGSSSPPSHTHTHTDKASVSLGIFHFTAVLCEPSRCCGVKIVVDQQPFVRPDWHQHPWYVQSHLNPISSTLPFRTLNFSKLPSTCTSKSMLLPCDWFICSTGLNQSAWNRDSSSRFRGYLKGWRKRWTKLFPILCEGHLVLNTFFSWLPWYLRPYHHTYSVSPDRMFFPRRLETIIWCIPSMESVAVVKILKNFK